MLFVFSQPLEVGLFVLYLDFRLQPHHVEVMNNIVWGPIVHKYGRESPMDDEMSLLVTKLLDLPKVSDLLVDVTCLVFFLD